MAEVLFLGIDPGPSPTGALNTIVTFPPRAAEAEFTEVEFFAPPAREVASENPNENDILLIVSSPFSASQFNVLLVPAPIPRADGTVFQGPPVGDDLTLFAGVLAPQGLAGKTIVFLTPTGGGPLQTRSPITGATGVISTVDASLGLNTITLTGALPVQPTTGDRAVVISANRALRRTPVVEVILE